MARSEKQKLKLFYILRILLEDTDESSGVSMQHIIGRLESDFGIKAERKSIYDDFAALDELGYGVEKLNGQPVTYTLINRPFEITELKLLVDAVQASRFISVKRSREIIRKLVSFAGKNDRSKLVRHLSIDPMAKTVDDSSYYNVDTIHEAINSDSKIMFTYNEWTEDKIKRPRHGGKKYIVSPLALIWDNEYYYLAADDFGAVKNFRVDKMSSVSISGERRDADAGKLNMDAAIYSRKLFGMYGGKEELVTLRCRTSLAGVIIDRFGTEPPFIKESNGDFFRVSVRVALSPLFYGWVINFGDGITIESPEYVRREILRIASDIGKIYGNNEK